MKMSNGGIHDRREQGAAIGVEGMQPGACASAVGEGTSEGAPPCEAARSVQPAGRGHVAKTLSPVTSSGESMHAGVDDGTGAMSGEKSEVGSPVAQSAKVFGYWLKREGDKDTVVRVGQRDGVMVYQTMSGLVQSVDSVPEAKFARLERMEKVVVGDFYFCVWSGFQGWVGVFDYQKTGHLRVSFPSGTHLALSEIASDAEFFRTLPQGGEAVVERPLKDVVPYRAWVSAQALMGLASAPVTPTAGTSASPAPCESAKGGCGDACEASLLNAARECFVAQIVGKAQTEGWLKDRAALLRIQHPELTEEQGWARACEEVESEGGEIAERLLREGGVLQHGGQGAMEGGVA
jgi:hypothetical protein